MTKKKADFVPEYTYEKLEGILKDSTLKAKTGKLDLEGKLYGIAAGYAIDFVDSSRAIKKPLDLTGRTEDNVFYTLLRVCAENQADKRTEADNRELMTKKFGYYQLFALVNSLNCEGSIPRLLKPEIHRPPFHPEGDWRRCICIQRIDEDRNPGECICCRTWSFCRLQKIIGCDYRRKGYKL